MLIVIIQLTEFFVKTIWASETNIRNVLIRPQRGTFKIKNKAHNFYFLDAVPDYSISTMLAELYPLQCGDTALHLAYSIHVHANIVPTMLTKVLYPLQDSDASLHLAVREGCTTCVEQPLSTPGNNLNHKDKVSGSSILSTVGDKICLSMI